MTRPSTVHQHSTKSRVKETNSMWHRLIMSLIIWISTKSTPQSTRWTLISAPIRLKKKSIATASSPLKVPLLAKLEILLESVHQRLIPTHKCPVATTNSRVAKCANPTTGRRERACKTAARSCPSLNRAQKTNTCMLSQPSRALGNDFRAEME